MRTDRWATIPSIGVALLPKLTCPMCWPAYAAIASTLGLGFLVRAQYLFAITLAFLLVAIAALSFRARQRHGYWPALLGVGGSIFILVGKFSLDSTLALYCGVGMLMGASVWNAWPQKKPSCCPQA
jgi:mercuric ion transport protein